MFSINLINFFIYYFVEPAPPVEEPPQPSNEEAAAKTPPQSQPVAREESKVMPTDEEKSQPTEKDEQKATEKEGTPRESEHSHASNSPRDESDFEDNITVTVPKPQTHSNNYHDYRDRQSMNGRYNRSNMNEAESSSNQSQSHQVSKLKECFWGSFDLIFFFLYFQYEEKEPYNSHDMMNKHGNEMNMNMRYGGMQSHQQQPHPQMMQQPMHR